MTDRSVRLVPQRRLEDTAAHYAGQAALAAQRPSEAEVVDFFRQNQKTAAKPLVITLPGQRIQLLVTDNGRYLPDVDVRSMDATPSVWTPLVLTGGTVERR